LFYKNIGVFPNATPYEQILKKIASGPKTSKTPMCKGVAGRFRMRWECGCLLKWKPPLIRGKIYSSNQRLRVRSKRKIISLTNFQPLSIAKIKIFQKTKDFEVRSTDTN